jgi:hypothetical protein
MSTSTADTRASTQAWTCCIDADERGGDDGACLPREDGEELVLKNFAWLVGPSRRRIIVLVRGEKQQR